MELNNRTALITGAGSTGGIGFRIAGALREAGATVIITGRDAARGAAAAAALGDGVRFIEADLTHLDSVAALAASAGAVDVLVNNAANAPFGRTTEQSPEGFDAAFATNVRGPFFLTAALAPHMVAVGRGSIINISTVVAKRPTPDMPVYGASKAAVEALTRSWALEFAHAGIRVNAIAPGTTGSESVVTAMGENLGAIARTIPLGTIGTTDNVADAAVFLASERSAYITGAVLPVDGGYAVA